MPNIFLYPGQVAPKDVRLTNPTISAPIPPPAPSVQVPNGVSVNFVLSFLSKPPIETPELIIPFVGVAGTRFNISLADPEHIPGVVVKATVIKIVLTSPRSVETQVFGAHDQAAISYVVESGIINVVGLWRIRVVLTEPVSLPAPQYVTNRSQFLVRRLTA